MRILAITVALLLAAGSVVAGGIDVKVNKDSVIVRPIDPQGTVAVSGPPGCVSGLFPMQVIAKNKKTDLSVAGAVMPDGSFMVQLPARPKDSIKLTFTGADGKKKDIKVKIPEALFAFPAQPATTEIRSETLTVPSGEPAAEAPPAPHPEPAQADAQIITDEKDLKASGVTE